eukprot:TRINITY_DN6004_c0_g1_i1.p1 TRINITY_DN6004_c0_g1~~TRINITY_DN6004_c0_g1_i1.p1  ORF type:complete len:746 (-),score=264.33 TRINITY_DN6004_c0_g1_i1:66-2303(-)
MSFILCGKLSKTQAQLKKLIVENGGNTVTKVADATIGLVGGDGANGGKNMGVCFDSGIPVLKEDFLHDCVEQEKLLDQKDYAIQAPDGTTPAAPATKKEKKAAVAPKKGKKGKDAAAADDGEEGEEDGEQEEGAEGGGDDAVEAAAGDGDVSMKEDEEDESEDKKKKRKRGTTTKSTDEDEVSETEVEAPAKKKSKRAPAKKKAPPKKKGKKKAASEDEEEEPIEEEENDEAPPERPPATVLDLDSIQVDVDEAFSERGAKVYIEDGVVYDALLNQTDIKNNNNKFYVDQMVQRANGSYVVIHRWGRVGAFGQCKLNHFSDKEKAKKCFETQFHKKSGCTWEDRHLSKPTKGKYALLEKDYESTSTKQSATSGKSKDATGGASSSEPELQSALDPRLQDLISLIFDQDLFVKSLKEFDYDEDQLPLGKLTKRHISKGYDVLKQIADVLIKGGSGMKSRCTDLSSEFYTLIPHRFGHRTIPTVIGTTDLLKQKLEMVEQLMNIEISNALIDQVEQAVKDRRSVIDKKYESLKCELVPVDDQETLDLVDRFVKNTHGRTHHLKLKVGDVFEVARNGEKDGFDAKAKEVGNIRLLWHGSRLTNFVGILSQGLRIAPPEAPVSGYMFGKGVYFADMVSKSANYCHAYQSDGHGLMLLCEVALGEMNPKLHADYNAGDLPAGKWSTLGKGRMYPNESEAELLEMDGHKVMVPCGTQVDDPNLGGSLMYNEFIVYDVKQVRMKYLVRMKFN